MPESRVKTWCAISMLFALLRWKRGI